jgi:hypothetical protein
LKLVGRHQISNQREIFAFGLSFEVTTDPHLMMGCIPIWQNGL